MILRILLVAVLINAASAQTVQVGPSSPNDCYKLEKINPNLVLRKELHVLGTVMDESGAPFKHSRIELRKYVSQHKQVSVQVVSTDGDGHFDLGIVKPGDFRLLASPNRVFKQPIALRCSEEKPCDLKIRLVANPSDRLDASCPIR